MHDQYYTLQCTVHALVQHHRACTLRGKNGLRLRACVRGAGPGVTVHVPGPAGMMQVLIPPGVYPGMQFRDASQRKRSLRVQPCQGVLLRCGPDMSAARAVVGLVHSLLGLSQMFRRSLGHNIILSTIALKMSGRCSRNC